MLSVVVRTLWSCRESWGQICQWMCRTNGTYCTTTTPLHTTQHSIGLACTKGAAANLHRHCPAWLYCTAVHYSYCTALHYRLSAQSLSRQHSCGQHTTSTTTSTSTHQPSPHHHSLPSSQVGLFPRGWRAAGWYREEIRIWWIAHRRSEEDSHWCSHGKHGIIGRIFFIL